MINHANKKWLLLTVSVGMLNAAFFWPDSAGWLVLFFLIPLYITALDAQSKYYLL